MTSNVPGNGSSAAPANPDDRIQAVAARYKQEFTWADQDAIEISLALLRMNRVISAAIRRYIDSLNLGVALTDARFTLLVTLYFTKDRRLAQNEISRDLGVSRTNITNLIDGLERDGLVVRVANPADRRVSHAQLTAEGEQLCAVLLPMMTRFMEEAAAGFDETEKSDFRDLLRRFRHDLRQRYISGLGIETDAEAPD